MRPVTNNRRCEKLIWAAGSSPKATPQRVEKTPHPEWKSLPIEAHKLDSCGGAASHLIEKESSLVPTVLYLLNIQGTGK